MAKHKSHQALYEILAKQRGREEGAPVGGMKPAPVVRQTPVKEAAQPSPRAAEAPRREGAVMPVVRPAAGKAPVVIAGAGLTYGHLALIGLAIAALCVFFYLLGGWLHGEALPVTEKHPTMGEIQGGPVARGLIAPGVERPAPGGAPGGIERPGRTKGGPAPVGPKKAGPPEKAAGKGAEPAPGPAGKPGEGEKPGGAQKAPLPTGPRYRVRIQTFDIGQPSAVDQLRDFLQQNGIETEDVPGRGAHVLYSLEQFADKKKSDDLAARIRKQLEAFEKLTHRRASKDAYSELIKE